MCSHGVPWSALARRATQSQVRVSIISNEWVVNPGRTRSEWRPLRVWLLLVFITSCWRSLTAGGNMIAFPSLPAAEIFKMSVWLCDYENIFECFLFILLQSKRDHRSSLWNFGVWGMIGKSLSISLGFMETQVNMMYWFHYSTNKQICEIKNKWNLFHSVTSRLRADPCTPRRSVWGFMLSMFVGHGRGGRERVYTWLRLPHINYTHVSKAS